jgi:HAD superfamily hydrolase (TIGR01509 family)
VHLLSLPRDLPIERRALSDDPAPSRQSATRDRKPIAVGTVSFDFGNTLVTVDRTGLRAVIGATAAALLERGTISGIGPFLAIWAEERDRQFREEVPLFREVDLGQRVGRVLARLRGMAPPEAPARWDDAAAGTLLEPDELEFTIETYSAAFVATMTPLPGVGPLLERLKARGFRLSILSNWPLAATIERYVEEHGWARHLDAVIVSQRIGTIKPHPEIFRQAAAILGSPPERILHVGDDWAADVVGASRAGWRTAYLRNRQTDTPLPTSAPDNAVEPDLVIDRLAEIEPRVELWTP